MTDEQEKVLRLTTSDELFVSIHTSFVIGRNKEHAYVTTIHRESNEEKVSVWERDANNFGKYAFYFVEYISIREFNCVQG